MDERQKTAWLKELRLNGFVILRDFVPREWARAAHDQIVPLLNGELKKTLHGDAGTARASYRLAFDLAQYSRLLGGPIAEDVYQHNPVIEELVSAYLGGADRWRRGWTQVECVWKGATFMDWHSDLTHDDGSDEGAASTPVRVTYNVPLVEFTWCNGAMEMLPGTHRQPRSFLADAFKDVAHLYPVPLRLRLGDALLRDGNGLHRGTPNLTDAPRPMLDQTYKAIMG